MAKVHLLLVPLTGQGHLTPMFQLARLLASQEGFLISVALTTSARARCEQASSPLPFGPNLHFHTLHDGRSDPLHNPSLDQAIASVPFMQHSLDQLLQALMASPSPVTCLISDTLCAWSEETALKFNIPRAEIWICAAHSYCSGVFYDRLLSTGLLPLKGDRKDTWITCIPGLPPMRASDFNALFLISEEEVQADAEKLAGFLHMMKALYGSARNQFRILINSSYDLESQAFDALLTEQVPALAVGPLALLNAAADVADKPAVKQPRTSFYQEDRKCLRWLDMKPPASTLYVAMGSDCKLEKHDMQELAYGLEASGHNFLWVIRPDSLLGTDTSAAEDGLPQGFQDRVSERGMVAPWVPQMEVLAHGAVGGFLSHCGWNSILESLGVGVPMIALPHIHEQGLNKHHVVEEWKVGIELKKNEEGRLCRIAVERCVRSLMGGVECEPVRRAAKEMKGIMSKTVNCGGSSQRNFNQFVEDLRSLCSVREKEPQDSKRAVVHEKASSLI